MSDAVFGLLMAALLGSGVFLAECWLAAWWEQRAQRKEDAARRQRDADLPLVRHESDPSNGQGCRDGQ